MHKRASAQHSRGHEGCIPHPPVIQSRLSSLCVLLASPPKSTYHDAARTANARRRSGYQILDSQEEAQTLHYRGDVQRVSTLLIQCICLTTTRVR